MTTKQSHAAKRTDKEYQDVFDDLMKYVTIELKNEVVDEESLKESMKKLYDVNGSPLSDKLISEMSDTRHAQDLFEDNKERVRQEAEVKSITKLSHTKEQTKTVIGKKPSNVRLPSKAERAQILAAQKQRITTPKTFTDKRISVYDFQRKKWTYTVARYYTYDNKQQSIKGGSKWKTTRTPLTPRPSKVSNATPRSKTYSSAKAIPSRSGSKIKGSSLKPQSSKARSKRKA